MAYQRTEVPREQIEAQESIAARVGALLAADGRRPLALVDTYGCQQNESDSERLRGYLAEMGCGFTEDEYEADIIVINTCAVRGHAEQRILGNVGALNHTKKAKPGQIICLCGCMVQQPHMAEKVRQSYPIVNLVFGPHALWRFPELLERVLTRRKRVFAVEESDGAVTEGEPRLRTGSGVKAWLSVMYGCNNFCTYCVVPYVRGRERSRRPEEVLEEARALVAAGYRDITLLGQNVNSYGKGLQEHASFPALLKELDQMDIPRIRFMTSHPKDLSDDLIEVMGSGKHILPQFHLPVQSGSNEILLQMNRHYTRERYLDRVKQLRKAVPGIGLSTDIIVGFPGETDEHFLETVSLVEEVGFDSAFTFIYSPRTGTKAALMPNQIPPEISSRRIQRLIDLQESMQQKTLQRFIGSEEEVLVEGFSKRSLQAVSGKGRHGVSITMDGTEADIGKIIHCRVSALKHNTLTAERIMDQ